MGIKLAKPHKDTYWIHLLLMSDLRGMLVPFDDDWGFMSAYHKLRYIWESSREECKKYLRGEMRDLDDDERLSQI